MQSKKAEKDSYRIEFSRISGYNLYKIPPAEQSPLPVVEQCSKTYDFGRLTVDGEHVPEYVGEHIPSGTDVRVKVIGCYQKPINKAVIAWFRDVILNPMPQRIFEWPIDLVEYRQGERYVLVLVFPMVAYPGFTGIKELLYQPRVNHVLDWRENPKIAALCINLLEAMKSLHENGYSYCDFDMQNIFYDPKTMEVFFRFTTNIEKKLHYRRKEMIRKDLIAPEFAPPFLDSEEYSGKDSETADQYSVCAILFRLMIGRLAYEGKGLVIDVFDPLRDSDEAQHRYDFERYRRYPYFIFDDQDNRNELGAMSENDLPRERWEQLPEPVRAMFQKTLGYASATDINAKLYAEQEWLEALRTYCWKRNE